MHCGAPGTPPALKISEDGETLRIAWITGQLGCSRKPLKFHPSNSEQFRWFHLTVCLFRITFVFVNTITAAYVRVSTKEQRTDSQLRELKQHCRLRGWKNAEYYVDKISGKEASRPELDRLVKDLRKGRVERVVTYKLDRLGRSITHLCLLVDEMTRLDVPLVCSSQGIDTTGNNPCGKFQLDVLKAVCEFERNLIRDRVNAGLAAAREKGIKLGRPKSQHERSQEVLDLKAKGLGVRAISRELGMAVSSVHSIVTNSASASPSTKNSQLYRRQDRPPAPA